MLSALCYWLYFTIYCYCTRRGRESKLNTKLMKMWFGIGGRKKKKKKKRLVM